MSSVDEAVKESVQTGSLVFFSNSFVSLHAGSVQSNIPVGQVLQEDQDFTNHGIKSIVVQLSSAHLDQVLVSCNNPLVHVVGFLRFAYSNAELVIEYEIGATSLLIASDILDQEAVSVEVG